MAFSFVQSANSPGGGTLVFSVAPTAGNVLVVGVRWEGATTGGCTVTQNSTNFTGGTVADSASGDNHSQILYLLNCDATNSVSITLPASGTLGSYCMAEFGDGGDTPTFDAQNTGTGESGTSLASGSINLDSGAAAWLVLGLASSYTNSATYSSQQLNGVAADGSQQGSGSLGPNLFWRLLTSSFSGGTATATASANDAWNAHIMSIKAGTSGGGGGDWGVFYLKA